VNLFPRKIVGSIHECCSWLLAPLPMTEETFFILSFFVCLKKVLKAKNDKFG
jgi:hypothetical protein